ncbi:MAG: AzlC family ABC transporter permease [Inquilinus sp.]|nr:AzlC family ABC transporter permease [Inquilinus sp.]
MSQTAPAAEAPFGSPRAAFLGAAREALGTPALVLGASYVGFGSLVKVSGWTAAMGLFSTATGWALPGQVALVELYAAGASLASIAAAVTLTNVRLLPMTATLMPRLAAPEMPRWRLYAAAHLVAVTGWVASMRTCPTLPPAERLPYLLGFSGILWVTTMLCTLAGYFLAGSVPAYVTLGLVFLNPIYFMLVLSTDLANRRRLLALVFGAVGGPLFHLATPEWGLLITGLVAGTLAYALGRRGGAA